jgi:hypothetical protein
MRFGLLLIRAPAAILTGCRAFSGLRHEGRLWICLLAHRVGRPELQDLLSHECKRAFHACRYCRFLSKLE